MTAPTPIDSVTIGPKYGDSTISVTFGATPSDDEFILLQYTQNGSGVGRTWPTGFTEFAHGTNDGDTVYAWKKASSESGATYTLTLANGGDNNQVLNGYRITGTSATPINVLGSIASPSFDSTPDWTGVTTTAADCLLLAMYGSPGNTCTITLSSFTSLAPGSGRSGGFYAAQASAGSSGGKTGSVTAGFIVGDIVIIALEPTGGGGGLSIPVAMAQYRQRWN